MTTTEVIPVLHDISSAQRLLDMARTVYALGCKVFVATRVYGAAAQNGVPEATRMALKQGRSFVTLPELTDAIELFKPDVVLTVSKEYGEPVTREKLHELAKGRVMLVFGGGEAGLPKQDVAVGKPIYPEGVEGKMSPVAEAALLIYWLLH